MKEIHELQEEKLMLSQLKSKSSLHKTHGKSLKKASKSGIAEEIEKRNKDEYDKLVHDHDDKASSLFIQILNIKNTNGINLQNPMNKIRIWSERVKTVSYDSSLI